MLAVVALVISLLALPFTAWAAYATYRQAKAAQDQTEIQREQVAAAREQTRLQRELAREALQPYVWADIRPDMQQGTVLDVVVGNSGPTVARNVRVTFDPPLPTGQQMQDTVEIVQRKLAHGLRSLAPNRFIRWALGAGPELLATDAPQVRTVRVDAEGPHGPLPTLELEIDIAEWRQSRDAPDGSLHHIRGEIRDLAKAVGGIDMTMKRAMRSLEGPSVELIDSEQVADPVARHLAMPQRNDDDADTEP